MTRFTLFNVVPRKYAHLFVASHYNIPFCLESKQNYFLPRQIREFERVQNHGHTEFRHLTLPCTIQLHSDMFYWLPFHDIWLCSLYIMYATMIYVEKWAPTFVKVNFNASNTSKYVQLLISLARKVIKNKWQYFSGVLCSSELNILLPE